MIHSLSFILQIKMSESIQSRYLLNPPLFDIYFKNKLVRVWTSLNETGSRFGYPTSDSETRIRHFELSGHPADEQSHSPKDSGRHPSVGGGSVVG